MLEKNLFKTLGDEVNFTNVRYQEAINLGFVEKDAVVLNEIGLPEFIAPNMWLHEPSLYKAAFILMGKDRDDRKIIYKDGTVYVEENDKLLLMANSIYELLEILYTYKVMIHKAGEELEDFDARENMIPDHLILEFEDFAKTKFANLNVDDHFWAQDVARLKSHEKDSVPMLPLKPLEDWVERSIIALQSEEYTAGAHFDELDINYNNKLQGYDLLNFSYSLAEKIFQIMKKYDAGISWLISIPIGVYDCLILEKQEVLTKLGKYYEPPSIYLLKSGLINNTSKEEYKRPIDSIQKSGFQLKSYFNSIEDSDEGYYASVIVTCKSEK